MNDEERDVQKALHKEADRRYSVTPPAWQEFAPLAHRYLSARRLLSALITAALCVVVLGSSYYVLNEGIIKEQMSDNNGNLPPAGQPSLPSSAEQPKKVSPEPKHVVCSFPSVQPDYLPWDNESPIPAPEQYVDDGTKPVDEGLKYASLTWYRKDADVPYYISLDRLTEPLGANGEIIPIEIEGVMGHLKQGPTPGDVVIDWDLGTKHCNKISLVLVAPDLSAEEARREASLTAESLSPRD